MKSINALTARVCVGMPITHGKLTRKKKANNTIPCKFLEAKTQRSRAAHCISYSSVAALVEREGKMYIEMDDFLTAAK